MPGWVIPVIIVLIAVVSRVVKAARRSQEKAQEERQRSATTHSRSDPPGRRYAPWEFEQAKEMPTAEEGIKIEMPIERSKYVLERSEGKADDEYQPLVDESAAPDEEAFKEETVTRAQSSGRRDTAPRARIKSAVPPKPKPIRIAGIPLSPQTIRQGIIMSEILRRPEF